jgi:hypothetical protein
MERRLAMAPGAPDFFGGIVRPTFTRFEAREAAP